MSIFAFIYIVLIYVLDECRSLEGMPVIPILLLAFLHDVI